MSRCLHLGTKQLCTFQSVLEWAQFWRVTGISVLLLVIQKFLYRGRVCRLRWLFFKKKINWNFCLGKPSVKIRMCTTPVTEGRNASLECATTGIPVPSIAWIRASTREVVSYKKTLVIEAIQRNHSGSYQCLAWNRVGNSSVSCTIDVHCKSLCVFVFCFACFWISKIWKPELHT